MKELNNINHLLITFIKLNKITINLINLIIIIF